MNPAQSQALFVDPLDGKTFLHPAVAVFVLILCLGMLWAPRRYTIVFFILAQNFVTNAQRISIGGMNFQVMRIMICVAILRVILRGEHMFLKLILLDKLVLWLALLSNMAFIMQEPSAASVTNSLGALLDALGGYFALRALLRDGEDLRMLVYALAFSAIALLPAFLMEKRSGMNPFAAFGGISPLSEIREGKIRVQGAYSHSILAGAYWAAAIPLLLSQSGPGQRARPWIYAATVAGLLIILMCASSTPAMSLLAAFGATLLFYMRSSLPGLRMALVLGLVLTSLVMKHPIWFLFTKIDLTGSSTGYYRYLLIDQFARNWEEWFLIGLRDTRHWGEKLMLPAIGLGDVTNQYIADAVRGGAASLALLIAQIGVAFRYIGRLVESAADEADKKSYWQLACCLLAHLFNFLGVSYFGQMGFAWWTILALCGSLYQSEVHGALTRAFMPEPGRVLSSQGGVGNE